MFLSRILSICAVLGVLCPAVRAQDEAASQLKPLTPAEALQLFPLPKISVQASDAPVSQAFESLFKGANLSINKNGLGGGTDKATVDIQNQTFWRAALQLQKETGYGVFRGSSGAGDVPHYSMVRSRRASGGLERENGPFLAFLSRVSRTRSVVSSLDFSANPGAAPDANQSDDVKVSAGVQLYLDPNIPILPGTIEVRVLEAVDENNKSIWGEESQLYSRGGDWSSDRTFTAPQREGIGNKIARLKLGYRAFVAVKSQTLAWDNVFEADAQTKVGPRGDGVENYEVSGGKATPRGFSLVLKAHRPLDGLEFRDASDALFDDVTIIDAAGKEWRGRAGSVGDRVGVSNPSPVRKLEANMVFGRAGDAFAAPLKLRWTLPTSFRPLEAEFEWNDVPLP